MWGFFVVYQLLKLIPGLNFLNCHHFAGNMLAFCNFTLYLCRVINEQHINQLKLTAMKNSIENIEFTRESNGTYIFPQISKSAARSKFNRMASGAGRCHTMHFEAGFANWNLNLETNCIECYTTYHSEYTVLDMYANNCKGW